MPASSRRAVARRRSEALPVRPASDGNAATA